MLSLGSSLQQAKAKGLSKGGGEAMNGHLKWYGGRGARIASKTLIPTETAMRSLCSGLYLRLLDVRFLRVWNRGRGEQNGLCAQQMEPAAPDLAAFPIAPEHGASRGRRKRGSRGTCRGVWLRRQLRRQRGVGRGRPEDGTHPSWLGRTAAFLTLRAQGTGAAMADASSIQHPQRAIALRPSLLRVERVIGGTAQGSVGL